MNKNNNKEDLLYSLPDYITGKLADESLIVRIQEEIKNNPEFRHEYSLLKETYSSIKELEFSGPPAHYFNNLIPRLNQRIENESRFSFAHLFRLANLFKYALPAITVVCLIVIITFTNKSNKDENMFIQSDNTINEIMKQEVDSTLAVKTEDGNTVPEETDAVENNTGNKTQIYNESGIAQTNRTVTETNQSNANIEDLLTETEEPDNEEIFMYENEFTNLSKTEQADIINKLSKENF